MRRVVAPSRLHFGLLNAGDVPERPRFGGCGLMIDWPGVAVRVESADTWSSAGPLAERAEVYAGRVAWEPLRVTVERCPPEHVGLGVGTALGLAVAKAVRPDLPAHDLAVLIGRGTRSGVGVHGFERGGFILDAGHHAYDPPALGGWFDLPEPWRVAVFVPATVSPWYGPAEQQAFDRPATDPARHDALESILRGIVASLVAADFAGFGEAIHDYNRRAGEPFAAAQGGPYAHPETAAIIAACRRMGFAGAGQSSWGPTAFAFVPEPAAGQRLVTTICSQFPGLRLAELASPCRTGARFE